MRNDGLNMINRRVQQILFDVSESNNCYMYSFVTSRFLALPQSDADRYLLAFLPDLCCNARANAHVRAAAAFGKGSAKSAAVWPGEDRRRREAGESRTVIAQLSSDMVRNFR